jgi:hypothetical protein
VVKPTPGYVDCKPCKTCKRVKPLSEFGRVGMGLRAVCTACRELAAHAPRTCVKCGETKPIDSFTASGMLRRACFDPCFLAGKRDIYWNAPHRRGRERTPPRRKAADGQKWCTKCSECKPLEEFPRTKTGSGRGSWCKRCVATHNRKQYERPEIRADRRARWDTWHAENPNWAAKWRAANLDRARENVRRGQARRRARLQGLPAEPYTLEQLLERDGTLCVLCDEELDLAAGFPEPLSVTVEHLECISWPESAGDVPSNVAIAHFICNSSRNMRPHPAAARKRAELLAMDQISSG